MIISSLTYFYFPPPYSRKRSNHSFFLCHCQNSPFQFFQCPIFIPSRFAIDEQNFLMPIVRPMGCRTICNQSSIHIAGYLKPCEMVRVASHALFSLGVEVVNLQTTSIPNCSIPQIYLPFCLLLILIQLYVDSNSDFYVSGIGSRADVPALKHNQED